MSLIGWETAVVSFLAVLVLVWFQGWFGKLLVDGTWILHQELVYAFIGIAVLLCCPSFLGSADSQLIAICRCLIVLFLKLLGASAVVAFIFFVFKLHLLLLSKRISRRSQAIVLLDLQRHEIIVLLILKQFMNNIGSNVVDVNRAMSVAELVCSLRVIESQLLLLFPLLHAHCVAECSAESNPTICRLICEVSWALLQYLWLKRAS